MNTNETSHSKAVSSLVQEEKELREKFVATLAHDLRSPLTAVNLCAELILRKTDRPEFVQTQASRIIETIEKMDQMIQNLVDVNLISAGKKLKIEKTAFDLIPEIKKILEGLTKEYGDRFVFNGPGKVEGYWSRSGIKRILENLASNAIKYGMEDETVSINLEAKADQVILSVQNEGSIISPEDQDTIFIPYQRSSKTKADRERGLGIGLSLVSALAEAHDGYASVESTIELGTTIKVVLGNAPTKLM